MNNSASSSGTEILPTVDYPPTIRGSLRLILQLKDAFLGSFNLVEEYRDQLLACKHGFTRELVVYQLTKGLTAIKRLRDDLTFVESQAQSRANRNVLLRNYLLDRYNRPDAKDSSGAPLGIVTRVGQGGQADEGGSGGSALIGNAIPAPINAPDPVDQALHGGLQHFSGTVDVDDLKVPEEINLATTVTESGSHLKPVVEFYRALYFLQMHFQLIMCQAANYALPVVTRPMTISERTFGWPTMPAYGLASQQGAMKDRLMEIHSDVTSLATKLHECLALVRDKMHQDKKIEAYFMRHTAAQETTRGQLLRALQAQRVYIESLERQNDRMAGLATKLDPKFAKSTDFAMMTGPGVGLPGVNQNSAVVKPPTDQRRPGTDGSRDMDPQNDKSSGGVFRGSGQHGTDQYHPTDRGHQGSSPSDDDDGRKHDADMDGNYYDDYYVNDTNVSGTGGGNPAIWVRQHGRNVRSNPDGKLDVELNRKIHQLRGRSQAVEELLIGVDSVASGFGRFTADVDHDTTQDFMNTDQYITSMYDEVFGQIPNSKSTKKSLRSAPRSRTLTDCQNIRTPSTNYTQAESLSSAQSAKHSAITVGDAQLNETFDDSIPDDTLNERGRRIRNDAVNVHYENGRLTRDSQQSGAMSPELVGNFDSSENTTSADTSVIRHLDTNVNSSHVGLTKLPANSKHPLSRIARTARSSPPTRRVPEGTKFPEISKSSRNKTVEDKYDSGLLHAADEAHLRQVPMVGTAECGPLCIPAWIAKRGVTKIHKPEDLLQEPKRSAFNKAVIAHRCRLVETILQADEERLEEIISLLLKE